MVGLQRDPRFTIGMIADWHGQAYELIAVEPRRRRDGRDALVLIWLTHCLVCGAPFETTTPQRKLKYPIRRCPRHRRGAPE